MHKKMNLFRRNKTSKVFPVKISTMDAELEFSLDYKVGILFSNVLCSFKIQNFISMEEWLSNIGQKVKKKNYLMLYFP